MIITAKSSQGTVTYTLIIDDSEKKLANVQPGDPEFIRSSAASPLVSEKLCGLALLAKRIEEGRQVAEVLQKAQATTPASSNGNHSTN